MGDGIRTNTCVYMLEGRRDDRHLTLKRMYARSCRSINMAMCGYAYLCIASGLESLRAIIQSFMILHCTCTLEPQGAPSSVTNIAGVRGSYIGSLAHPDTSHWSGQCQLRMVTRTTRKPALLFSCKTGGRRERGEKGIFFFQVEEVRLGNLKSKTMLN